MTYEQRYAIDNLIIPDDLPNLEDDSNSESSETNEFNEYNEHKVIDEAAVQNDAKPVFNPDQWAGDYYYGDLQEPTQPPQIMNQLMQIRQLGLSPMDLASALLQWAATGLGNGDNDDELYDLDDNIE
ncbi:hypothetical protein F-VV10_0400 [Faustovirus]|nr:hypothetical protein F-VV10_0400 [Faustovirus]